jgi:hypothetical protein
MRRIFTVTVFVAALLALSQSAFAQSESRDDLLKKIEAKRVELALLEKQILEPSEQDKVAYTDFLRQPDTGLIRLLPREKYDDMAYRGRTKSSVTIRGGGAYYSFTSLSHDYNSGSPDLSLEMGKLGVGFAGANYGMLTGLGDVPIEQITLEHPTARFMAEYVVPTEEPEARAEARRFGAGVTIGGALYAERITAKADTTYLLRSISYIASDVLVTFRIVRKDTDGSVIIVWKLLKKYPTPKLARNN